MKILTNTAGSGVKKLRILSAGMPGSGKTTLLQKAPGDWGVLPFDINSRASVEKAWKEEKAIGRNINFYIPDTDFLRAANIDRARYSKLLTEVDVEGKDSKNKIFDEMKDMARAIVNTWKPVLYELVNKSTVGTILVDGCDEMKNQVTLAHFGRTANIPQILRGAPNGELSDIFDTMLAKHCIFTHTARYMYRKVMVGLVEREEETSALIPNAWSKLGYKCNATVIHYSPQNQVECDRLNNDFGLKGGNRELTPGSYMLVVINSRHNPSMVIGRNNLLITKYKKTKDGVEVVTEDSELANWQNVAMKVYPEWMDSPLGLDDWFKKELAWK